MKIQGVSMAVPRSQLRNALLAGVMIAVQSYCLYSAVALIPVGFALLVFHMAPLFYVLFAWAMGKESPRATALLAIAVALVGLGLALGTSPATLAARWAEMGEGLTWAFAGAVSFVFVLYMNAHSLRGMDGRLRTFLMTAITASVVLACAAPMGLFALPRDATGWFGLAMLTLFYGAAMCTLFISLPRVLSISMIALNFEAIATLGLGYLFLGQSVAPIQVVGAFMTVGAIAWVGAAKK
jgi:drug/metabolite transporter (DMT)-like permease